MDSFQAIAFTTLMQRSTRSIFDWSPSSGKYAAGGRLAPQGAVLFACLFTLRLFIPMSAPAQDAEVDTRALFDSLTAAHSYEIEFDGTAISGPGADWLTQEVSRAQYFLIGERHATAEIPALSGALYAKAAQAGYEYAALEVGPLAGQKADALLREGGYKALETFLTSEPSRQAIAFLNFREEARMAARIAGEGGTIWGLDQEFIYSMPWHLSRLAALAETAEERRAVASLQTKAQEDKFFLGRADPAELEELRRTFAKNPIDQTRVIIDALIFTNSVYRPYITERNFFSRAERRRENYMKRNLVAKLREARSSSESAPKVFFKFGGFHSGPRVYDDGKITLGTFVEEWALGHGHETFNLFIGCNGGRNLSTGARGHAPQPCASMIAGEGGQNTTEIDSSRTFAGLLAEHDDELWLVDVRPLRNRLGQWDFLTTGEKRWIAGFDALLLVPNVTPATQMAE